VTDGPGSTSELANSGGTVTDTYRYDAFGALRAHVGTSANQWSFTGEQVDGSTSLQYLRARYYDPETGRFLTQDPVRGLALSPQSLNAYPYVLNNPCGLLDPWGLQPDGSCRPPTPTATPTPTPTLPATGTSTSTSGHFAPRLVGEKLGITPTPTARPAPIGTPTPTAAPPKATPTGTPTPTAADPCAPLPYMAGNDFALFPTIKQLLVKSSGWFNNTCAGDITRAFVGGTVATAGAIGLATPGLEWTAPILIPAGYQIAVGGPPGQPPFENCF
jgi:RHS repeat-associated protein